MSTAAPPRTVRVPRVRRLPAVAADVVAVLAFVAVGRDAHAHGLTLAGLASTAWPFLTGLAAGWLAVGWLAVGWAAAGGRPWPGPRTAFVVTWLSTVTVGMALRVVAGQGTTVVFWVVATGFLGLFLLAGRAGVRAGVHLARRRRAVGAASTARHVRADAAAYPLVMVRAEKIRGGEGS